jgi:PST family polysaccharide transporter
VSFVPGLHNHPRLFLAALFYGVAQGVAPIWFFQGLERMTTSAGLEIGGKVLSVACVFAVAHTPADDWKVVLVQALPSAVTATAGILMIHRVVGIQVPRAAEVHAALQRGWPLFLFRSGLGLYGLANAFVLGLFAPATQVGFYASAEKISKSSSGLLSPLREAIFPRLSNLARHSPSDARRLASLGSWLGTIAGLLVSVTLYVLAPFIIRILMGRGFEASVAVLRILSVLPLVIAITESVGLQWLLPQGRDLSVTWIICAGGALNIALSIVLAPRFGHIGMAWAVVTAETFVALRISKAAFDANRPGSSEDLGVAAPGKACFAGSGN